MTSPMKRTMLPALAGAGIATLILPAAALADSLDAANNGALPDSAVLNTLWVTIAAVLVLFMLAGLMCLEAGMSRMKNVGTLVPKALVSMAVAGIVYYAAASRSRSATATSSARPASSCAITAIRRRRSGSWASRTR